MTVGIGIMINTMEGIFTMSKVKFIGNIELTIVNVTDEYNRFLKSVSGFQRVFQYEEQM